MSRTFNRAPISVNTPSSSDIKNYYFNHCNWKGLTDNKNFLAVDQESFADCNNVYVDSKNLLRSRPSIKKSTTTVDTITLTNIINFWAFTDVIVYLTYNSTLDYYNLYFVKDGVKLNQIYDIGTSNIKLNLMKTKIFIFTSTSLKYFDIFTYAVGDATDFIYVPETKVLSTGEETSNEAKNVLTTSEIYVYLYNSAVGAYSTIMGKTVIYTLNSIEYSVVFDEYTSDVLVNVAFEVSASYVDSDTINLTVSSENTYALYSTTTNTLLYSVDGDSFKNIDVLTLSSGESVVSKPAFTQDNSYVYICTTDTIYIVSVKADTSTMTFRFSTFTDVKSYMDSTSIATIFDWYYNTSVSIIDAAVFDFVTYDDFAGCMGVYNEAFTYDSKTTVYYVRYVDGVAYRIYSDDNIVMTNTGIPRFISYKYNYTNDTTTGCIIVYSSYVKNNHEDVIYDYDNCKLITVLNFTNGLSVSTYDSLSPVSDFPEDVFTAKILTNKIVYVTAQDTSNYLLYTVNSDLTFNTAITITKTSNNYNFPIFLSTYGDKLLTDQFIYYINDGVKKSLIVKSGADDHEGQELIIPIAFNNYIYYATYINAGTTEVYSSYFSETVELKYTKEGVTSLFLPDCLSELTNNYFSKDNILYISEYRENTDGNYLLYLPVTNNQKFNYNITNLRAISQTEMGIFLKNEIWYVYSTDNGYAYNKTKLQVGTKANSDTIVSYDGTNIMFPCERGFVSLAYQDFVATSEQTISFLSDSIYTIFNEYNDNDGIKLFKYGFWIILYKEDSNVGYIYDTRTASWWPISCKDAITKIISYDEDIYLLINNVIYTINKTDTDYYDYDGTTKTEIPWYLYSQKLYLNAINYYKHIVNITLGTVLDTNQALSLDLEILNYRKNIDNGKPETIMYSVDSIRTFVQRLNYSKVNEFQYVLSTDTLNSIHIPLSVSNISIKYKITGQVR